MIKKFKIELEVSVEENNLKKDNMSIDDYITVELSWARESFNDFNILNITEVEYEIKST